jgi:2-dehydro-3-deoxygluconokinase
MSKIIVMGHTGVSITIPPHDEPDAGDYQTIDAVELVAGGSAATTAITLERLGVAVSFVGVLGDDPVGNQIRAKLDAEGVDVSRFQLLADHTSPTTVIQVDGHGRRSFLYHPGTAVERLAPRDLERISCSVVHLSAPELLSGIWPQEVLETVRKLKVARRTVSIDTCVARHGHHDVGRVVKEHRHVLELIDIVFTTPEDGKLISGRAERESMVNYFHEQGVKVVVVKINAEDALVSWQGGLHEVRVANPDVVDPSGSSESCTAGYLAGHVRSLDPLQCTRLGLTISGLCARHEGELAGTANRALVEKVLDEFLSAGAGAVKLAR